MTVTWDYSAFANSYADRPSYAGAALDAMFAVAGLRRGDHVCDVGAGTGHLTVPLVEHGLHVDAVEPNEPMRTIGTERIAGPTVRWHIGTAEQTGMPSGAYDAVTFGSSFNVTDRQAALRETARLLRPRGWFLCMWNHRDVDDPLQAEIEATIRSLVPGYDPGNRRADQRGEIRRSALFEESVYLEGRQTHIVDRNRWANGWRSHATVQRQAGEKFDEVVDAIERILKVQPGTLRVPYISRVWVARIRDGKDA